MVKYSCIMTDYQGLLKLNSAFANFDRAGASNLAHCILLSGDDEFTLKLFAEFLCRKLVCQGKIKPCGKCADCIKTAHNTHADVQYYPKESRAFLVEDALEIVENSIKIAYEGGVKVFVLNFGAGIGPQPQNKLLKVLEEPRENVFFIILSSNVNNVLNTVRSRAVNYQIPSFSEKVLKGFLKDKSSDDRILDTAVFFSGGSVSLAQSLLNEPAAAVRAQLVFDLLTKLNHSKNMLPFVNRVLREKQNFTELLSMFGTVVRKALSLGALNAKPDFYGAELAEVYQNFGAAGLAKLGKLIPQVNERFLRNANFTATADFFILKILEVRFYANSGER